MALQQVQFIIEKNTHNLSSRSNASESSINHIR